ncbi:MAG: glycosyltransferase [Deltaproteobacteria bacterium]
MLGQLMRFGFTGLINTVIDFAIFNLFLSLTGWTNGPGLLVINLIAVTAAATNSFYMNRHYTFRASAQSTQFRQFIIATLCGMALNSLGVMLFSKLAVFTPWTATEALNLGKLCGAVISAVWNFLLYRHWVFKRPLEAAKTESADTVPGLTSIIIPAYNESRRLPQRLVSLASSLSNRFPLEILVVDDGSTDDTAELVRLAADHYPNINCHSYHPNKGKGQAVKTGMLEARGEYLIFTDADDSFSPEHIELMAGRLQMGSEVVIACRQTRDGERSQGESGIRRMMGRTFNRLVQGLILPGFSDTQCGLKGFRSDIAHRVFSRQVINGFAFDVEILALTRTMGYAIEQIPVSIADSPGSRVNKLLDPIRMLLDILRVKVSLAANLYELENKKPVLGPLAWSSALFTLALALRVPWLWEFPRFIDELKEVNLAYQIYLGQALPLHNAAHDIGAMHNYLLAGLFRLLGPSIYWPRLYVACISALGVVLVYHLGKRLYGKYTGLLAAVLLAFNGMHILNSHMAWANCTTPAFFTAALLALAAAEKEKKGWCLILSGLLWAAALQTHASVIIFIPVIAIYVLSPGFRQRSSIHLKWHAATLSVFLLGYFNMIWYNIASRGGSIRWLSTKKYALEQHLGLQSYLANLEQMAAELVRTLSSCYGQHDHLWQYLSHPFFILALVLLLYGAYRSFLRHDIGTLPLWLLLAAFLVMPAINQRYVFYMATRYIMPVVICSLLMTAEASVHLFSLVNKPLSSKAVPVALAAVLLVSSLQYIPYAVYCTARLDTNLSNRLALDVVSAAIDMSSEPGSLVLLDKNLPVENSPFPSLLALTSRTYRELPITSAASIDSEGLVPLRTGAPQPGHHLVAIISDKNYHAIANQLDPQHKACFSNRVILPAISRQPRHVYVLQWDAAPSAKD